MWPSPPILRPSIATAGARGGWWPRWCFPPSHTSPHATSDSARRRARGHTGRSTVFSAASCFAAHLASGATVIGALAGLAQAALAALLLRRTTKIGGPLEDAGDLASFVGIAVCLVPLVTTLPSAVAYARAFQLSFAAAWTPLFAGDSLSMLLFAPPVMYGWREHRRSGPWCAQTPELLLGQAAILAVSLLSFARPPVLLQFVVVPYAMFPLLAWSAIRCGPRWTAFAILEISTVAAWCTARGTGPFATEAVLADRVLQLQIYLAMLALTGILLSALSEQGRRAYEQLVLQVDIREGFLNGSDDILVLKDLDGRTVIANSAYARLVGRTREQLIGGSTRDFMSPAESALARERDGMVVARGHAITFDETIVFGTPRHLVVTRFPVRDASDVIRYTGVVARDVTAERELTERLQRAQRVEMMGHLAAGVAHDLNNLLTSITLSAGLLKDTPDLSDGNREALDDLEEAGAQASRLTGRLLSLGRARLPQPVAIRVDDTIRELEPMLHVLVRGIVDLRIDLGAGTSCVVADPITIEQLVLNLVSNARDAVTEHGSISVTTEVVSASGAKHSSGTAPDDELPVATSSSASQWVRLCVTDTGIGMDEETLSSLFVPFFSTKGERGTGLGLYTTLLLVRQAGGEIHAKSERGTGSTFVVDLPIAPAT